MFSRTGSIPYFRKKTHPIQKKKEISDPRQQHHSYLDVQKKRLPCFRKKSIQSGNRLHGFFVTTLKSHKDAYVKSFFPRTPRLWSFMSEEFFL